MYCSLADLTTISLPPPMSYDPEEEGYVELCLHGCYRLSQLPWASNSGRPVILFSLPDEFTGRNWTDSYARQYFWLANYRIVLT
jgi:hypothetical protein